MNDCPLVSVIMATYNTEYSMLKESIESIIDQTYRNLEIIIIDDCSSIYNDYSFIELYKDDRIILLHNSENKGLAYSLNRALKMARGKYVARMDSDDISLPDRIEAQVNYMENHSDVVVLGGSAKVFGSTNAIRANLMNNPEFIRASFLFHNALTHPSVMFNRLFFINNSLYYNETYKKSQDYELWVRVYEYGTVIHELKRIVLLYRTFPGQASAPSRRKDQREFADNARTMLLKKLCIPTERELSCHRALSYGENNNISKKDIDNWCKKLLDVNKTKRIYKQHYLKLAIANQYLSLYKSANGLRIFGIEYVEISLAKAFRLFFNQMMINKKM